jgi:hypothetical protein
MSIKKGCYLFFLLFVFFFSVTVFSNIDQGKKRADLPEKLLEEDLKITLPLKRILYSMGISCESDLKNVVMITQQKWLRKNDRAQLDEIDKKKEDYIYQLKDLGCVDKIFPSKKNYDYCLLLGGDYQTFISRLEYLIDRWEKGVRFNTLIFVGEYRLIDFEREKKLLLNNSNKQIKEKAHQKLPQTEIDMMKFVYENRDIPLQMRELKTLFISSPISGAPAIVKNNVIQSSNIYDAILTWFNTQRPSPGSCLVVSSQPYVGYQESIVRSVLRNYFEVEAIGDGALSDTKVSVYLDNLARWLYQEALRNDLILPSTSAVSDKKVR